MTKDEQATEARRLLWEFTHVLLGEQATGDIYERAPEALEVARHLVSESVVEN